MYIPDVSMLGVMIVSILSTYFSQFPPNPTMSSLYTFFLIFLWKWQMSQSLLVEFICSPDHKRNYNAKMPPKVQGHISAQEKVSNQFSLNWYEHAFILPTKLDSSGFESISRFTGLLFNTDHVCFFYWPWCFKKVHVY